MSLLRFLGIGGGDGRDAEPTSLLEIARKLEDLPESDARFVAAFSYLLARIAGADLEIEDSERAAIAERLERFAEVGPERAALLAEAAVHSFEANSPSDDHLVARAFRDMTEEPERLRLVRCLYAVAAADSLISTREDNEIFEIANVIGVRRSEVVALRAEFREYLGTLKTLPGER